MDVVNEDTFDCVIRLVKEGYKKPIALDHASGSNPGGGWRGKQQGTQEEVLCRRSDLGLQLEKKKYPMPHDSYYYLPKVTITEGNVQCAVIASELKSIAMQTQQYLIKRITDLYDCAIKNNHDVIILGAWGCGAFKETEDDAEILAKVFKLIATKYKDQIKSVFAIYRNKKNLNTFKLHLRQ